MFSGLENNNNVKAFILSEIYDKEYKEIATIENISYEEALKMYTISDTNIITKNDWGPAVWMMIHFFAFNLQKKNDQYHIEKKYVSNQKLTENRICKENYKIDNKIKWCNTKLNCFSDQQVSQKGLS